MNENIDETKDDKVNMNQNEAEYDVEREAEHDVEQEVKHDVENEAEHEKQKYDETKMGTYDALGGMPKISRPTLNNSRNTVTNNNNARIARPVMPKPPVPPVAGGDMNRGGTNSNFPQSQVGVFNINKEKNMVNSSITPRAPLDGRALRQNEDEFASKSGDKITSLRAKNDEKKQDNFRMILISATCVIVIAVLFLLMLFGGSGKDAKANDTDVSMQVTATNDSESQTSIGSDTSSSDTSTGSKTITGTTADDSSSTTDSTSNSENEACTVTFRVTLPSNTPEEENIYLTGSFNGWNEADARYILERTSDTTCEITIDATENTVMEYKFTRGTWDKREQNRAGADVVGPNQTQNRTYSVQPGENLVSCEIEKWSDLLYVQE